MSDTYSDTEVSQNWDWTCTLTNGQIALLETIKPLSEWNHELYTLEFEDNFDDIDEVFWQNGKPITYNDFYYAGVDKTLKVEDDDPRAIELNYYRSAIYKEIQNRRYRDICDLAITNYRIGYKCDAFEDCKSHLLDMIDRYTSGIVSYDYDTIKKTRHRLNKEIYEAMYHPSRVAKWLEAGNDIEDYLQ